MENTKKAYFFGMKVISSRDGEQLGVRCGVVFAVSEDEAFDLAWEKYGSDSSCGLWVEEVEESGFCHTMYKCAMV